MVVLVEGTELDELCYRLTPQQCFSTCEAGKVSLDDPGLVGKPALSAEVVDEFPNVLGADLSQASYARNDCQSIDVSVDSCPITSSPGT